MQNILYGGIEMGGTKIVCGIGTAPDAIIDHVHFPTRQPADSVKDIADYFHQYELVRSVGVAAFGPIDINLHSRHYGFLLNTPKAGWSHFDLLGTLKKSLDAPFLLTTDVNGAAIGEHRYGAGSGVESIAYVTVGTGIGVGSIINGQLVTGIGHTETGHMIIPRHEQDHLFISSCPYHESCLEGLASGSAMTKRWGRQPDDIVDDLAWDIEAYYLAVGIVNLVCTTMPMKIIIGGGVMHHSGLIEAIRRRVSELINSYLDFAQFKTGMSEYIVHPNLGDDSGITGAIAIAIDGST